MIVVVLRHYVGLDITPSLGFIYISLYLFRLSNFSPKSQEGADP